MSTKRRNTFRPAFMKNFSKNEIERFMLIDDEYITYDDKKSFVKEINERLWVAIQEVNSLCKGRILPFVKVNLVERENEGQFVRVIVSDINSNKSFEDMVGNRVNIDELSHLIVFKTLAPERIVMVSDEFVKGNAKMLIDKKDQIAAAVDIFLDIAMFNSFSFLRNLPNESKKSFSKQKYDFFKTNSESCYYRYIDSDGVPPAYYSFAFSARTDDKNIDFGKYMYLWDSFIESNYKKEKNQVPPPNEQLKQHIDICNIPNKYFTESHWKRIKNGDYLFLKINIEVKTNAEKRQILYYLGFKRYSKKIVKLVPLNEYHNPLLKKWLKQLNISAFKIVVDK